MDWKNLFDPKKVNQLLEKPAEEIFRLVCDSEFPDGQVWSDTNLRNAGLDPTQFPRVAKPSEEQIISAAKLMMAAKERAPKI